MSVIVLVAAPSVVPIASAALSALAAAAAAHVGLKALEAAELEQRQAHLAALREEAGETVEVRPAAAATLRELVAERATLYFGDDRVTLVVQRDIRGTLTVRAKGDGIAKRELQARAEKLLGLIQQQVAYRDALQKLKQRGFTVEDEARLEDGTARVRVRLKR